MIPAAVFGFFLLFTGSCAAADSPALKKSNVFTEETMNITIGSTILTAELANNSSARALKEMLSDGPVTIDMKDYSNFEKVGDLGKSLPTNNTQVTTEAGDLILYQGHLFVIYYAPNSWNFTRLGKIQNVTASQLKRILGSGDVTVTLSQD